MGSPRCPPLSCSARRIPAPHACAASHAPRWLLAPKTTYVALRDNNLPCVAKGSERQRSIVGTVQALRATHPRLARRSAMLRATLLASAATSVIGLSITKELGQVALTPLVNGRTTAGAAPVPRAPRRGERGTGDRISGAFRKRRIRQSDITRSETYPSRVWVVSHSLSSITASQRRRVSP